jgi:3-hydroxyisobutyrate dehydrogenase-like beta-hydroxyacid dehydrogenase
MRCVYNKGVTKICNNLSLAISMVGTAEAMNLVTNKHHNTTP